jgi:hypothetical protein
MGIEEEEMHRNIKISLLAIRFSTLWGEISKFQGKLEIMD